MEALEKNTARLPNVEIVPPTELVGRSTIECIQSGLYFGHRAMVRELTREIRDRRSGESRRSSSGPADSRVSSSAKGLRRVLPDLVLAGLERAVNLNEGGSRPWAPEE